MAIYPRTFGLMCQKPSIGGTVLLNTFSLAFTPKVNGLDMVIYLPSFFCVSL